MIVRFFFFLGQELVIFHMMHVNVVITTPSGYG